MAQKNLPCLMSLHQCRSILGCLDWPHAQQTPTLIWVWFSGLQGTTGCSGVALRAAGRASTCCRGCRFTCALTTARSRSSARRRTAARSSPPLETWRITAAHTQVRKASGSKKKMTRRRSHLPLLVYCFLSAGAAGDVTTQQPWLLHFTIAVVIIYLGRQ